MITYLLIGILFLGIVMDFSLRKYIDRCNDVTLPVAIPLTIIVIILWPVFTLLGAYLLITDLMDK